MKGDGGDEEEDEGEGKGWGWVAGSVGEVAGLSGGGVVGRGGRMKRNDVMGVGGGGVRGMEWGGMVARGGGTMKNWTVRIQVRWGDGE